MKKQFAMMAMAVLLISMGLSAAEFPQKDLEGVIQWAPGGSTDALHRSLAPHVEKELGAKIGLKNMPGNVGALATESVFHSESDGYTLLLGAENPMLYKVLGVSDVDYSNFITINIVARAIPVLVAHNDAPYNSLQELLDFSKANPNTIKVGSHGPGGAPSVVMALIRSQHELSAVDVLFNGDGPTLKALKAGEIDITPATLGAVIDDIKAKKVKVITLLDVRESPALPGIAPISEDFPEYAKYLPWGPFYGAFVKKGTPHSMVRKLQDSYTIGGRSPEHREFMKQRGYQAMNISGLAADEFLKKWQSVSAWLVWDAGVANISPETLGISRR